MGMSIVCEERVRYGLNYGQHWGDDLRQIALFMITSSASSDTHE